MIVLRSVVITGALLALGLATSVVNARDDEAAALDVTPTAITAYPAGVETFQAMRLRVVGPDGTVMLDEQSESGMVSWLLPIELEDGWYNWEAVFLAAAVPGEAQGDGEIVGRSWGQVRVEHGLITEIPAQPPVTFQFDSSHVTPLQHRVIGWLIEALVPAAHAQDLVSSSTLPSVFFDDTNDEDCTPSYDWRVTTSGGTSNADINNFFQITGVGEFENGGPCAQDVPIVVLNHDGLNGATTSSINSIVVPANGDVNLANGSVYVDRSVNRLGVGTTAPVQELHIQNSSPGLRLDDPGVVYDIQESADDLSIFIVANVGVSEPTGEAFTLEDANGFFGIWQPNPEVALHVQSPDGLSAGLLVTNPVATPAARTMFELRNHGTARFKIVDLDTGGPPAEWFFAGSKQDFRISFVGTPVEMRVVPGGNMFITGTLSQGSDRAQKQDIQPVSGADILGRVRQLELSRWEYISTPGVDHIGPMAQDFHELFGVGEEPTSISTLDTSGVALAAIQALADQNDTLTVDNSQLAMQNERLRAQNLSLEQRLYELESVVRGLLVDRAEPVAAAFSAD